MCSYHQNQLKRENNNKKPRVFIQNWDITKPQGQYAAKPGGAETADSTLCYWKKWKKKPEHLYHNPQALLSFIKQPRKCWRVFWNTNLILISSSKPIQTKLFKTQGSVCLGSFGFYKQATECRYMQFEISKTFKIILQIFLWECDCFWNCNFTPWEKW